MSPWWLFGLVFLMLGMAMVGGLIEGSFLAPDNTGILDTLLRPDVIESPVASLPIIGPIVSGLSVAGDWLHGIWTLFTFDYPFFEGPWIIFRFIFIGVSVGLIMTLVLAWVRGVGGS